MQSKKDSQRYEYQYENAKIMQIGYACIFNWLSHGMIHDKALYGKISAT